MRELATFRARSEGPSPSPSHSSVSTPAKSPELLSLLGSIGYTLDESIAFQHRPAAPLPRLSIVMPGVGYLCEDESFLSAALQPCLEGDASFTVAAEASLRLRRTRDRLRRCAPLIVILCSACTQSIRVSVWRVCAPVCREE